MRPAAAPLLLAAAVCLGACADSRPPAEELLDRCLHTAAAEWTRQPAASGAEAFRSFRSAAAAVAREQGAPELAARIDALRPGVRPAAAEDALVSRLLRRYLVARYERQIVADLQTMIGFRTHAIEGRENWGAPEFLRQRAWLESRAAELGLEFRSFDGRVDELQLPGGDRVLAVLTHGDVQDVRGQTWTVPPWSGELVGRQLFGRGSEDDKGPIVTTLYVLAALRDSGWPVGPTLRLIIANAEESSWEEIPYYLERRPPPDLTLGVDASYPVTHAQKAWCEVTLAARAAGAPVGATRDWRLLEVSGGSGLSIIAERAEARLAPGPAVGPLELAAAALARRAADWAAARPPARLEVQREGETVRITALGRGGHSSVPESGHNAFGDLSAFLAGLDLERDARGAVMTFAGTAIGTEVDGTALGVAHHDRVMGPLTVNLAAFDEVEGEFRARMSLRVPRGLGAADIEQRIGGRLERFSSGFGVPLELRVSMPLPPHFVPPDGALVQTLLSIWNEVTGERGSPVAIGGGTQARLFPDGVDFGPALAMERYRGHGPDEYITVDELLRNGELTLAALWALSR